MQEVWFALTGALYACPVHPTVFLHEVVSSDSLKDKTAQYARGLSRPSDHWRIKPRDSVLLVHAPFGRMRTVVLNIGMVQSGTEHLDHI